MRMRRDMRAPSAAGGSRLKVHPRAAPGHRYPSHSARRRRPFAETRNGACYPGRPRADDPGMLPMLLRALLALVVLLILAPTSAHAATLTGRITNTYDGEVVLTVK